MTPAVAWALRPIWLLILYVLVALLPLLLAHLQELPHRNFWREFSSGLAMVAFAMLWLEFLLSGRHRHISGRVGIDLTLRFHQLAALALLVFIFLHPFLYVVPRLTPNPGDALTSLQRMFTSSGLRTGVIAWFLLLAMVALAWWRHRLPVRYELGRAFHGVAALAVALLSLHHTLSVGRYSGGDPWLAAFWWLLALVALASLLQVYVIKPWRQRRQPYRVVALEPAAHRMWRLVVEPEGGHSLPFVPGQFAWVNIGHSSHSLTEHPFSMSSAPGSLPQLEFTIKENGDFTRQIGQVALGTEVYVDGPHGAFTMHGHEARRWIFIAGGVGLAPLMSMLRQLRDSGWPQPATLIYGNRIESQILYRSELEAMAESGHCDVHWVLSEPPAQWSGEVGELTADVLARCLKTWDPEACYFVCGPTPMMNAVENALVDAGIPGSRIVSERFEFD